MACLGIRALLLILSGCAVVACGSSSTSTAEADIRESPCRDPETGRFVACNTQDGGAQSLNIICSLKSLPVVPQGELSVEVNVTHVGEDGDSSESVDAFEGSYNFHALRSDGEIYVTFQENKHVQDEVGSWGCTIPPSLKRGMKFCEEPIEIDASLGTEQAHKIVHAFAFSCRAE